MTISNKNTILDLAKELADSGKLDRAVIEYEKLMTANPNDMRIKLRIAELYAKQKHVEKALTLYRDIGKTYTNDGFYLKSVTVYKTMLRLNPSLIDVNKELASLYERMGLSTDAIRQYNILASFYEANGNTMDVIAIREKIVALKPDDGIAKMRLAELYQRDGRIDDIIDIYEKYANQLEKMPDQVSKLTDIYEKILAHRPDNEALICKLIHIYVNEHKNKMALKWLESTSSMVEKDASLLALQARLYAEQNQNETARKIYFRLAELHKNNDCIQDALNAYCDILVLLPDEEDKLVDIVEELKPGSMDIIIKEANHRRQLLESEDIARQALESGLSNHTTNDTQTADNAQPQAPDSDASFTDPNNATEVNAKEITPKADPAEVESMDELLSLSNTLLPNDPAPENTATPPMQIKDTTINQTAHSNTFEKECMQKPQKESIEKLKRTFSQSQNHTSTTNTSEFETHIKNQLRTQRMETNHTPPPSAHSRQHADAAYDLALVYQQAGLSEEATLEFIKASDLYQGLIDANINDEKIKTRLESIQMILMQNNRIPPPKSPTPPSHTTTDTGKDQATCLRQKVDQLHATDTIATTLPNNAIEHDYEKNKDTDSQSSTKQHKTNQSLNKKRISFV